MCKSSDKIICTTCTRFDRRSSLPVKTNKLSSSSSESSFGKSSMRLFERANGCDDVEGPAPGVLVDSRGYSASKDIVEELCKLSRRRKTGKTAGFGCSHSPVPSPTQVDSHLELSGDKTPYAPKEASICLIHLLDLNNAVDQSISTYALLIIPILERMMPDIELR